MRLLKVLLIALLAMPLLSAGAVTPSAEEVIKETTDKVLERLSAQREELQAHPDKVYNLIQELVIPHFDFPSMSRWVLGTSTWRDATEEQRRAFMGEFRTLLVGTYAKVFLEYTGEEIRFFPSEGSPESSMVKVRLEIHQPGGTAPTGVMFRLHVADGSWKVVDVEFDGVSLIKTYRGEFASAIQREGLDALIARLGERNARYQIDDSGPTD